MNQDAIGFLRNTFRQQQARGATKIPPTPQPQAWDHGQAYRINQGAPGTVLAGQQPQGDLSAQRYAIAQALLEGTNPDLAAYTRKAQQLRQGQGQGQSGFGQSGFGAQMGRVLPAIKSAMSHTPPRIQRGRS